MGKARFSAAFEEGAGGFSASRVNAAGVTTELLVQPLANVRRAPTAQYKSMRFVADVPVSAGVYACAVRQVDPATGQRLVLVPLGLVTVAA